MKHNPKSSLHLYYEEAGSWAADQRAELSRSRRIAWWVAGAAAAVAVLEALALLSLTPLKTVVPYTLLVDRQTGYVQALDPINPQRIGADAALTQSFLVQYVIARESFDIDALQDNYRKVLLWSAGEARSRYSASMQYSNAGSPLARLPRSTVVETRVKSVSSLGTGASLVRFETQRRDAGGGELPARAWVAVIRYHFSERPMTREDRFLNPLGFEVVRYRRDAEALNLTPPSGPGPIPRAPSATTLRGDGQAAIIPAPAPSATVQRRVPVRTDPDKTPYDPNPQ